MGPELPEMVSVSKVAFVLAKTFFAPATVTAVAFAGGSALTICGVYVLAGLGWSLLAGAVPCFALGLVLLRGLIHA